MEIAISVSTVGTDWKQAIAKPSAVCHNNRSEETNCGQRNQLLTSCSKITTPKLDSLRTEQKMALN